MISPTIAKLKFEMHLKELDKIKNTLPESKDEIYSLIEKICSLIKLSFDDGKEKIKEFKQEPAYLLHTGMSEQQIEDSNKQYNLQNLATKQNHILGYIEELELIIESDQTFVLDHMTEEDDFIPNTAFVIMAIGKDDSDEIYKVIKKECEKLKVKATRVDEISGSGNITDDIVNSIEQSEFIIVDLTHERPNVYYELGYAHGVGNDAHDILLVAKKGTKIHFDISTLRVKLYDEYDQLHDIIYDNLKTMIEQTRSKI